MRWVRHSQSPVRRRARRPFRAGLLTLSVGLLVSCGGEPRLVPPTNSFTPVTSNTPELVAATPVSTIAVAEIGDVVWATASDPATSAPIEPVSDYRPDALRIIASVHVGGLSAGSTVAATWEYNDTSLDAFTTLLRPTESGADQWISFYIERDPEVEWPVGTYEVTISVDGTTVRQAAVEVREES